MVMRGRSRGGRRRLNGGRRRGGGRRRFGGRNPFQITPKRSLGNPTPKNSTTRATLTFQIPIQYTSTSTSVKVTYAELYTRIYGSVGRSVPAAEADDFTMSVLGYRWTSAHTYTGKLTVYDVDTNAERGDYGNASSRANVGFNYSAYQSRPISAATSKTTVLSLATLSPAAATNLEVSVTVDVVWKNVANPEIVLAKDEARRLNALSRLEHMFILAGLDSPNSLSDSVSVMSLSPHEKKSTAAKLMRSIRGKGSVSGGMQVEYDL